MKTVTVESEDLIREVKWMSKLRDNTSPASSTMQVRILLGALQLRRTDLDQYRESLIPGLGADQSCIEVDSTLVMEVMKLYKNDRAVVSIDEDRLVIQVGGQIIRVKGLPPGKFPEWPVFTRDKERMAAVGARKLTRAMTSLPTDENLPLLTNVSFDGGAMYTTDRFRMTRVIYDTDGFTALVPASALRAFSSGSDGMAIITTGTGSVAKQTDIPMVRVASGGRSVVVRTPDGDFPNVERLIPESPTTRVMLHRDSLLNAASGHRVVLKLDGTTMTAVGSDQKGEVEIEKSITVTPIGESAPFTATLMTKYLTDCLRAMNSGMVLFEATEPDKPLVISDVDQATVHLVMPIRKP